MRMADRGFWFGYYIYMGFYVKCSYGIVSFADKFMKGLHCSSQLELFTSCNREEEGGIPHRENQPLVILRRNDVLYSYGSIP